MLHFHMIQSAKFKMAQTWYRKKPHPCWNPSRVIGLVFLSCSLIIDMIWNFCLAVQGHILCHDCSDFGIHVLLQKHKVTPLNLYPIKLNKSSLCLDLSQFFSYMRLECWATQHTLMQNSSFMHPITTPKWKKAAELTLILYLYTRNAPPAIITTPSRISQNAAQVDLPWLPVLPVGNPVEGMKQAL